jgi:uncharacterized membrane protein required for colicin V production
MNLADIVILVVIGMSVIYGFYHGFVQTVASVAGLLLAIGAAFVFGPRLANTLLGNADITSFFATYTDAVARVGDFDLASSSVVGISASTVESILQGVKLPKPLADVLQQNLLTQAFSHTGATTVNSYVSNTIVAAAIQVLSYLACFAIAYIVFTALLSLLSHVMNFPILRQLDWLAGGIFGLGRGVVLVYVLLLLVPLASTVVPTEGVSRMIESSTLAHLFSGDGFFVRVISQK